VDLEPQIPDPAKLDEVLALFARYQRRLHAYIASVLPDPAAADEVLQETNIVVWRKLDQFVPETDFRAWVYRIAHFEIRKYLERRRRQQIVAFSEELVAELTATFEEREPLLEARRELLPGCLEKLAPADRELVDQVYGSGVEVSTLAERSGRAPTSLYRSLRRIRQLLFDCVELKLAASGVK
jgi:RNA polymerase sigma-70 factor (ECF subfamily)